VPYKYLGFMKNSVRFSIILIGFTGQISLGHGAFFGVGAYAAAILATYFFYIRIRSIFQFGINDEKGSSKEK